MYTDYFKLSEPPFSLTPDPRYMFMSERHREGLAHLFYGVQQPGGFVQLTGDIGSGKTTLCRCLVKQLPPATDVALILNPRLTVIELLATVCDELGIPYPPDTTSNKVLIDALNQRLLESHAQHKRTVLIIDEAQNLHADVLEQIRLLTNLETSKEKLLQVILIGQPELMTILKGQKLRQLSQRITAYYHLLPLSRSETYAYVSHRLKVAGRSEPLFTAWAMHHIYRLSRGIPRIVNIICDRALLGAYALDKQRIGAGIIRKASREARGIVPWYQGSRGAWIYGILALLVLLTLGALFLASNKLSIFHRVPSSPAASKTKFPAENASLTFSTKAEKPSGMQKSDPIPTAKPAVSKRTPPVSKPAPAVSATKVQIPSAQTAGNLSLPVNTPADSRIIDILKDAVPHGKADSSFDSLYSQWGTHLSLRPSEFGCKVALAHGFECIFQTGNWSKLQRYDLPAILELRLPDGLQRRATLIALTDEFATLAIGKQEYEFPLSEIDEVWHGSFILIWKPPFAPHRLALGDKGKDVTWIRNALDAVDGKESTPGDSELYDQSLKQRVIAFQQKRSLVKDGCVGNETLLQLTLAMKETGTPSISRGTHQ